MNKHLIRKPFDLPVRVRHTNTQASITEQHHKDSCDINNIINRHGALPLQAPMQYADLPDDIDFQSALDIVQQAQQQFDSLPAVLRSQCLNDPHNLPAYMADPANAESLISLGLLSRATRDMETQPVEPASAPAQAQVQPTTTTPPQTPPVDPPT